MEDSPLTTLANSFATLSSTNFEMLDNTVCSSFKFDSSTTNTDPGIDLNPPQKISTTESTQILQKTHSLNTQRFKTTPHRRKLFTLSESKFNKLRRLNSVGTISPRCDEQKFGQKLFKTKTININTPNFYDPSIEKEFQSLSNQPAIRQRTSTLINKKFNSSELDSEMEISSLLQDEDYQLDKEAESVDYLNEITSKTKSYQRFKSDNSNFIRSNKIRSKLSISPLKFPKITTPLKIRPKIPTNNSSILHADISNLEDFDDFLENYSDDGFNDNENSPPQWLFGKPKNVILPRAAVVDEIRQGCVRKPKNRKNKGSPICSNLNEPAVHSPIFETKLNFLIKRRKSLQLSPLGAPSPNSFNSLLSGNIMKNNFIKSKRGLFKNESTLPSMFKKSPKCVISPRKQKRSRTDYSIESSPKKRFLSPNKRYLSPAKSPKWASPNKNLKPVKMFLNSPLTPSKVKSIINNKLTFARTRSINFNSKGTSLQKIKSLPGAMDNPILVRNGHFIKPHWSKTKNYSCLNDKNQHEIIKASLERMNSNDSVFTLQEDSILKLSCKSDSRHPQLNTISVDKMGELMESVQVDDLKKVDKKNEIYRDTLTDTFDNSEAIPRNCSVINGEKVAFDVIDCRYPYEFKGGCIKGGINICCETQLRERYFAERMKEFGKNYILIFHCEFSSERAPKMMKKLRDIDRQINQYPELKFPEVYLLTGGYKAFYNKFPQHCNGEYCEMVNPKFTEELLLFKKNRTDKQELTLNKAMAKSTRMRKPLRDVNRQKISSSRRLF